MLALVIFVGPSLSDMSFMTAPQTRTASTTQQTQQIQPLPTLRFEIATTTAAQARGLGGRVDIPENYGMLFVFPTDDRRGFWMKDMLAPIDIVWLSDTGVVLGYEDSVAPNSYPKAFYPPQPVKYVLETKAGEIRRRGWNVGTIVPLPLPYRS